MSHTNSETILVKGETTGHATYVKVRGGRLKGLDEAQQKGLSGHLKGSVHFYGCEVVVTGDSVSVYIPQQTEALKQQNYRLGVGSSFSLKYKAEPTEAERLEASSWRAK